MVFFLVPFGAVFGAWAQSPVTHEYFDPLGLTASSGGAEVVHQGVAIPPPVATNMAENELLLGPEGPSGDEALASRTNGGFDAQREIGFDDDTDMEGTLNYFSVFNPSVVPFKRSGVLDGVSYQDGEAELVVADPALRPVALSVEDGSEGRDRFWGSVVVQAQEGVAIPIPSVSASQRVFSIETVPRAEVGLYRDGAENFYAILDIHGEVRVNYLVDAPKGYFSPPDVPGGIRVRDLDDHVVVPPELPDDLQEEVKEVLKMMGISSRDQVSDALDTMVRYFRSFEPLSLNRAEREESLYLTIVKQQRGVCRHRAMAFVITAHGMGLPARYVYNEAHAFVEVGLPLRGWVRIDLGGGAEALSVHNGDDKVLHSPEHEDPFAKPDAYQESYSQVGLQSDDGLESSGFERVEGLPEKPARVRERRTDDLDVAPFGFQEGEEVLEGPESDSLPVLEAGEGGASDAAVVQRRRVPTEVIVDVSPEDAMRGDEVQVFGRLLDDDGVGLGEREVFLGLQELGDEERFIFLGEGVTRVDGHFVLRAELPTTMPVGSWDLYVYYQGDMEYLSSRSE